MQCTQIALELRPDAVENIRKMYDIDRPERLKATIDLLEEWVRMQTHFVKKDFSRDYLEKTYITCKGSMERAKKQLDSMCTLKTVLPKFFMKTNVKEELLEVTKTACMVPLPKTTEDYNRVVVVKVNSNAIEPQNFLEFFQLSIITCEYLKKHDYVDGIVLVEDFRSANIGEMWIKMNTVDFQQLVTIITKAYGARLKNIYLISESKTIELYIKLIKSMLSPKIMSRLHVIANFEELHKYLPKELLPEDFGGDERTTEVLMSEWVEALSTEDHVEYMRMMNGAGTDESLRPSARFNEDYMGMPGSFRNLSVD